MTSNISPRVLIIDDAPIDRGMLLHVLQKEGFTVLTASGGVEGLEKARTERPDIILLDVNMPDMNGFETCAYLQHDSRTTTIPILFLSSADDLQNRLMGFTVGAVDFIAKPFEREEVLARIRVHLRIRRAFEAQIEYQKAQLRELQAAQKAILLKPDELPGARFEVYYRPMHAAGGDFYDVIELGNDIYGYFTADIGGHGLGAAFITSALKALLRQNLSPLYTPVETMQLLNGVLLPILGDDVVMSACIVRLNRRTNRVVVVSAGHPPVVLIREGGGIQEIAPDGDLLCAFDAPHFDSSEVVVSRGDRLLMFSDGLIEAEHGTVISRREGMQNVTQQAERFRKLPLADLVQQTACAISAPDEMVRDDILLVGVEV